MKTTQTKTGYRIECSKEERIALAIALMDHIVRCTKLLDETKGATKFWQDQLASAQSILDDLNNL